MKVHHTDLTVVHVSKYSQKRVYPLRYYMYYHTHV